MDKQTKLLAELLSASELMVIDQFMQLMVKNNTFERRLEKRTQNIELLNAKIVALEKKENIYQLEIQKLKQNSIDTKTAKITNTTVPQVVIKKKIIDGADCKEI
jgi:NAD(P)H-nitrite reductase large subunit